MNSGVRRIVDNIGWMAGERILRMGVGLFLTTAIARTLGPSDYGAFGYCLTISALFNCFANLSIDAIAIKELTASPDKDAPEIIKTIFLLRMVSGTISWLCANVTYAILVAPPWQPIAMALVSMSLLTQAFDTIDCWNQSKSRSRETILPRNVAFLIACGIKAVLVYSNASISQFSLAFALESILTAMALAHNAKSQFPGALIGARVNFYRVRYILQSVVPLILIALAAAIYTRIDQLILAKDHPMSELGIYASAISLSQALNFIPLIITSSLFPVLIRKYNHSKEEYYDAIEALYSIYIYASLVLSGLLMYFSPIIISMLYGPAFSAANTPFRIHVITNVFISIGVLQHYHLLIVEKANISLYKNLTGVMSLGAIGLILIPDAGATGAAISVVAAQATSVILSNSVFDRASLMSQMRSLYPNKLINFLKY